LLYSKNALERSIEEKAKIKIIFLFLCSFKGAIQLRGKDIRQKTVHR
jgi:hypothetical protein